MIERLKRELPEHILSEAWEGEGDIVALSAGALQAAETALGAAEAEQVRRYVGVGALSPQAV